MGGGNRRNDNNRNFDRGYGNSNVNRQINPWDNNTGGGNFRQGSGGGGGGGVNNDVLSLANSLVNNLLRNNQPPSLLDLPQRGGGGYGNQMNFGRFDDRNGRVSFHTFFRFFCSFFFFSITIYLRFEYSSQLF